MFCRDALHASIACVLCNAINGVQRRDACNASLHGQQIKVAESLFAKYPALFGDKKISTIRPPLP
ncbi:MAG: hypothetical protein AAB332_03060 [Planctomycetota bacterium]